MRKPRNSIQNVIGVLPGVVVSVIVFASYCILSINGAHERDRTRDVEVRSGGFMAARSTEAFRRLEKRREGRGSQSELQVKLPDPSQVEPPHDAVQPLYAGKSLRAVENVWLEWPDSPSPAGWQHLPTALRKAIDQAQPHKNRWDGIVLHHSSTTGGNAAVLAMYHEEVRRLEGGLAYHFVIGNGSMAGDGEIELGDRWNTQAPAGTPPGEKHDPRSISICLIGDFSSHPPTSAQLTALNELIHYLRAKLGHVPLRSHNRSGDGINSCPGRYFPREAWFARFNPS